MKGVQQSSLREDTCSSERQTLDSTMGIRQQHSVQTK